MSKQTDYAHNNISSVKAPNVESDWGLERRAFATENGEAVPQWAQENVRALWAEICARGAALDRKEEEAKALEKANKTLSDELDLKETEEGLLEDQGIEDAKKIEALTADAARKDEVIRELVEVSIFMASFASVISDREGSRELSEKVSAFCDALTRAKGELEA